MMMSMVIGMSENVREEVVVVGSALGSGVFVLNKTMTHTHSL
jgi:hypothetical protein